MNYSNFILICCSDQCAATVTVLCVQVFPKYCAQQYSTINYSEYVSISLIGFSVSSLSVSPSLSFIAFTFTVSHVKGRRYGCLSGTNFKSSESSWLSLVGVLIPLFLARGHPERLKTESMELITLGLENKKIKKDLVSDKGRDHEKAE